MHKVSRLLAMVTIASFMAAAYGRAQTPGSQTTRAAIPPQSLASALQAWAQQSGWQLMYDSGLAVDQQSKGAPEGLQPIDALTRVLDGTGLVHRFLNERTVSILPSVAAYPSSTRRTFRTASVAADEAVNAEAGAEERGSPVVETRGTSAKQEEEPTEVIVTAQKRTERLQDVPVPVTAIGADALVSGNQLRLQDYYTRIPGLSVTPGNQSTTVLTIRGITTGQGTNPTVGITVDDVPYGSSTSQGGGGTVPDIDPSDLARVELLRGPQGTFYGASSMGGLLKFVTLDPSTERLSGSVQAGLSSVRNGDEIGHNVRGSVNVPLSDTVAFRASGFTRRDPGYIDDPVLGIDGINSVKVSGGRLSALWRPSEDLSLKLSALLQQSEGDGTSEVDAQPGIGDLQQSHLRGTGWYDREVQAYNATLSTQLGGVSLTSVSGYNINSFSDSFDASFAYGPLTQALFGVAGAPLLDDNETKKFTQEFRFETPIGERFSWLFGAFYTDEDSRFTQNIVAVDPATGAQLGSAVQSSSPTTYEEYAAFTDLTFHVTDRFDIQFGGRESEIKQSYTLTQAGPYVSLVLQRPSPYIQPRVEADTNAFTYLVTPRLKVSPDLMVYARLASGYRAGGPNISPGLGTPPEYSPDKTQNYEIGAKGDFFDGSLVVDASAYYIDWKDIQLYVLNPQTFQAYTTNASRAKSQGIELSVESKPIPGLTTAAWVAWNEAELTEAFPAGSLSYGVSGDRLPFSSRFSGSLSLDQEFPVTGAVTAFVGGVIGYVGERKGVFTASSERQNLPAYAKTDLRAGVRYNSWTANVFVTNLTDKRGVLTGGLGALPPFAFTYIQPRTGGLSVTKTF